MDGRSHRKSMMQQRDRQRTLLIPIETHLLLGLGFLDVVSTHFDSGAEDGSGELHHIHSKQVTELLRRCEVQGAANTELMDPRSALKTHVVK